MNDKEISNENNVIFESFNITKNIVDRILNRSFNRIMSNLVSKSLSKYSSCYFTNLIKALVNLNHVFISNRKFMQKYLKEKWDPSKEPVYIIAYIDSYSHRWMFSYFRI